MDTIWHLTTDGRPASPGTEGFVHCSFTAQLEGTLATHFASAASVTLLRLDHARLGERLVLEPSRAGALFPHLYGTVAPQDVLERVVLRRDETGGFDLSSLASSDAPAGPAP